MKIGALMRSGWHLKSWAHRSQPNPTHKTGEVGRKTMDQKQTDRHTEVKKPEESSATEVKLSHDRNIPAPHQNSFPSTQEQTHWSSDIANLAFSLSV